MANLSRVELILSAEEQEMLAEVAKATGVSVPTFLRLHIQIQYMALQALKKLRGT